MGTRRLADAAQPLLRRDVQVARPQPDGRQGYHQYQNGLEQVQPDVGLLRVEDAPVHQDGDDVGGDGRQGGDDKLRVLICLLYTSDAADE